VYNIVCVCERERSCQNLKQQVKLCSTCVWQRRVLIEGGERRARVDAQPSSEGEKP